MIARLLNFCGDLGTSAKGAMSRVFAFFRGEDIPQDEIDRLFKNDIYKRFFESRRSASENNEVWSQLTDKDKFPHLRRVLVELYLESAASCYPWLERIRSAYRWLIHSVDYQTPLLDYFFLSLVESRTQQQLKAFVDFSSRSDAFAKPAEVHGDADKFLLSQLNINDHENYPYINVYAAFLLVEYLKVTFSNNPQALRSLMSQSAVLTTKLPHVRSHFEAQANQTLNFIFATAALFVAVLFAIFEVSSFAGAAIIIGASLIKYLTYMYYSQRFLCKGLKSSCEALNSMMSNQELLLSAIWIVASAAPSPLSQTYASNDATSLSGYQPSNESTSQLFTSQI